MKGSLIMSETHTLLEDLGPAVIQTLLEALRPGTEHFIKRERTKRNSAKDDLKGIRQLMKGESGKPTRPIPPLKIDLTGILPYKGTLPDNSSGGKASSSPTKPPRGGIGKYLMGLGAAGAAGAGAYSLRDQLGDAADDAGEHINSLRDKLANIIAAHHEA
jgi:hypothetical protein